MAVAIAVAELRMVSEGRWEFAERAVFLTSWLLPLAVVVGVIHVAIGARDLLAAGRTANPSRQRLDLVFLGLASLGTAAVAVDTGAARALGGWAVHDVFRDRLGQPVWLFIYLATATAIAFSFGLGLKNLVDRFEVSTRPSIDAGSVAGALAGLTVWVLLIDSLGSLILGSPTLLTAGGN